MTRIAISEDDLNRPGHPQGTDVYAPVGGPAHPNVYGPVEPPPPDTGAVGGVRAWVLIVAAVVLCTTFGVGGLLLGQSGRISKSDRAAERQAERARFQAERDTAVAEAISRTAAGEKSKADARVARSNRAGFNRGRASGLREGREEGISQGRQDFTDTNCLTSLSC